MKRIAWVLSACAVCAAGISGCKKDPQPPPAPSANAAPVAPAAPPSAAKNAASDAKVEAQKQAQAEADALHWDENFAPDAKKAISGVFVAAKTNDPAALKPYLADGFAPDGKMLAGIPEAIGRGCLEDLSEDEEQAPSNLNSIHCPTDADEEAADIPGYSLHFVKEKGGAWKLAGIEPREAGPPGSPLRHTERGILLDHVPAEAAAQIDALYGAAENKDFDALARVLGDRVKVDDRELSREEALAAWKANPRALIALSETLDQGCGAGTSADAVVCPTSPADEGGSVAFTKDEGGGWKVSAIVDRPVH